MNENNVEQPTRRAHRRAVMPGRELFEADAADLALDGSTHELTTEGGTQLDDVDEDGAPEDNNPEDDPLLAELPPHWGVFNRHD